MSDDTKEDITRLEDLDSFEHDESDNPPELTNIGVKDDDANEDQNNENDSPESFFSSQTDAGFQLPDNFDNSDDDDGDNFEEDTNSEFGQASFTEEDLDADEVDDTAFVIDQDEEEYHEEPEAENNLDIDFLEEAIEEETLYPEENDLEMPGSSLEDISTNTFEQTQEISTTNTTPPPQAKPIREDFKDLTEFAKNITLLPGTIGGNPPYSVQIYNINNDDTIDDLVIILKELGIYTDDTSSMFDTGFANGTALVPQISEYLAILLCHKLRNLEVKFEFGPSSIIHESKSYDEQNKGRIASHNLRQNHRESLELDRKKISIEDILLSTSSGVEGFTIKKYLGILSEQLLLNQDVSEEISDNLIEGNPVQLSHFNEELISELRKQALAKEGNAIIGLSFNLEHRGKGTETRYTLVATGTLVWVEKEKL